MNTEKIEKLKKSLSNSKIPADLKPKIEAEIKRLEDLDAKQSEPKEEEKEVKPVAKKTTTRKPRTTKTVAKKTSTAKPSETSKPKRTAMSVAKEIRKDGESWKDAMARASKVMKEKSKTATKDVETELQKLTKLVRGKKELKGQIGRTNLLIDAKRKAKPMGRRVSKDGNVYYENRANRTDRGTFGKYHLAEGGGVGRGIVLDKFKGQRPNNRHYSLEMFTNPDGLDYFRLYDDTSNEILAQSYNLEEVKLYAEMFKGKRYAEGGYLTDPNFGNFQNTMFADGGGIPNNYEGKSPKEVWELLTYTQKEHFLSDHLKPNQFDYFKSKGLNLMDLAKVSWDNLGYGIKKEFGEHISMGQYAKGGGIRRKNGQTYDYGRVWTKDHNEFDKGSDHEVEYRRKKRFELGGNVVTDLAGHTGGSLGTGDPSMLDGFSNTAYTGLVGETGAMSSGEMFAKGGDIPFENSNLYLIGKGMDINGNKIIKVSFPNQRAFSIQTLGNLPKTHRILRAYDNNEDISPNDVKTIENEVVDYISEFGSNSQKKSLKKYELGGGLPSGVSQSYMITESLGNPAQHFAKGGGIRRKNGQTYDYGRVWTKDHNEFDKGSDHEVNYRRKGKFLGVFADGGGVKGDKYDGKTEKIVEELKNLKGGLDNKAPYVYQRDGYIYVSAEEGDNYADYDNYLYIDEKLEDFADKYDTYWDWENAGAIILVPLSDGYAKGGVMATGGGVDDESPKIYVADLEAYNNGRLSGEWLDLTDYPDAETLMKAIQEVLKKSGGEEYAIHDVENIPNSMYSEYMGEKDFEELYVMIDLSIEQNLPLAVVQDIVTQYDTNAVYEFAGKYNSADEFAEQLVDDIGGVQNFYNFERYLTVSQTDRRLLAQENADMYVDDVSYEDGGNRIIEEAGLDGDEYEEADSDRQEEMVDEAKEIVYDRLYNEWYDGLNDPYYFLVEEQGIYDAESFANASFVQVDYEELGDALEDDYAYIYYNSELYVFNVK